MTDLGKHDNLQVTTQGTNEFELCVTACQLSSVSTEPPHGGVFSFYFEKLREVMSFNAPEIDALMKKRDNAAELMLALLRYFRMRETVKHPAMEGLDPTTSLRIPVTEHRLVADDALENILIASPSYPRHAFGVNIDWFTNHSPAGDLEWSIQLHRQYSWALLSKAYIETSDEKYALAFFRQLTAWLDSCSENTRRHPAWGLLEAGIRGHYWTHHFFHFLNSENFTPELLARFLCSLYDHASYLYERGFSKGNHGLMEAEGLAFIAITFPEFNEAQNWRDKAVAHLVKEIDVQVLPDGMHYELSFHYHVGVILWFLRTFELCKLNGMEEAFPGSYSQKLNDMLEIPVRFIHPPGMQAMFGDDQYVDMSELLKVLFDKFQHNPALAYNVSGGKDGKQPPLVSSLPSAGFYSFRSDWSPEAVHFILKCGPNGGWHCQPDNASFELFAFGRYLMPDTGCYIYHGDTEARAWFRRTRVHQTMTLDNLDSAFAPRLMRLDSSEHEEILAVENMSYPGLLHKRTVIVFKKSVFIIIDNASGPAAGLVGFHFQVCPCVPVIDPRAMTVDTAFSSGGNVLVKSLPLATGCSFREEDGLVSYKYAEKESRPAWALEFDKKPDNNSVSLVTVLAPYRDMEKPEIEFLFPGRESGAGPETDMRILVNNECCFHGVLSLVNKNDA